MKNFCSHLAVHACIVKGILIQKQEEAEKENIEETHRIIWNHKHIQMLSMQKLYKKIQIVLNNKSIKSIKYSVQHDYIINLLLY